MTQFRLSALDHHFAGFIQRLEGRPSPGLWVAAALTSAAAADGSACLDLSALGDMEALAFSPAGEPLAVPPPADLLRELPACRTVGAPGAGTPLVLDERGRLYLHRFWDYERRVAEGIVARVVPPGMDAQWVAAGLERFFPAAGEEPDLQRLAVKRAVSGRFTVISGGPGTGKTSIVARMLALLASRSDEKPPVVLLAAPTGKAAARLADSIAQAVSRLHIPEDIAAAIPQRVQTIHRLLGVQPGTPLRFRHDRDNPLPCDLLVVDEVSMVDLPLMASLLDALGPHAGLVLLGDKDQLSSVEAGSVLADICGTGGEQPDGPARPLSGRVIHLTRSYRFGADSGIGRLSGLIRAGDGAAAWDVLQQGRYADLVWRELPSTAQFDALFSARVREGYAGYGRSETAEAALDELDRFRVLSPHREGALGVERLNRLAGQALGLAPTEGESWPPGLAVMVTGNNYELGLFNGDTAVLRDDPDAGVSAFFRTAEGLRRVSPFRLPRMEPAFCLTVHKSQGSEFRSVLLVLPDRISELLTRELLYTAVTRASARCEIWCSRETFLQAVDRRTVRNSGLRDQLWSGYF